MEDNFPASCAIEKFTAADLSSLREELTRSGLDSRQAAELIGVFLIVRGYGVSSYEAVRRGIAHRILRLLAEVDAGRAGKSRPRHVTRPPVMEPGCLSWDTGYSIASLYSGPSARVVTCPIQIYFRTELALASRQPR